MEEELLALIRADAAVQTALGDRINWVRRPPKDQLPGATLQRIGGDRGYHMKGPDGLVRSTVQADVWGLKYEDAKLGTRAVQNSIDGFRSAQPDTRFQGIFIETERDMPDEELDGLKVFRVSTDFTIWHTE